MPIKYKLKSGEPMDHRLYSLWSTTDGTGSWTSFVPSLDDNILQADFDPVFETTTITFKSEESLTFFILKWS